MFSSSRLFSDIPCPSRMGSCSLVNCIFSHESQLTPTAQASKASSYDIENAVGDQKRRKLEDGSKEVSNVSNVSGPCLGVVFTGITPPSKPTAVPTSSNANINTDWTNDTGTSQNGIAKELVTATRPISPPPVNSQGRKSSAATKATAISKAGAIVKQNKPIETLNPRPVSRDPAPHMTRYQLLKYLHDAMVKLNDETRRDNDPEISSLHLDSQQLICAALDEEERFAIGKASIYTNLVKNKIAEYRKMKLNVWVLQRQAVEATKKKLEETGATAHIPRAQQGADSSKPINLETELSVAQQIIVLNRYVLEQQDLRNAGYVLVPPTEEAMKEAQKTVEASGSYEKCERCDTRFQVFPDGREEDGAITTNGKCKHHWGKIRNPEKGSGSSGPIYTCCNTVQGTPGCTLGDSHVFKINGANRLASVMPFVKTPDNDKAKKDFAVVFDCEMGWTCYGLELIRLSATTWPQGEALIDVLVRPLGTVLDLNTKFSGVSKEQFFDAEEYHPEQDEPPKHAGSTSQEAPPLLRIVSSPKVARSLLLSYISPETILIGHSLDNDMNVMRLIHPKIVDTSLLFPHPGGLPYRYGLKALVKKFLQRNIQVGTEGHDSLEDSRATGDLVRWKLAREWATLKEKGWTAEIGVDAQAFYAPGDANEEKSSLLPPYLQPQSTLAKPKKRRHGDTGFQIGTG